MTAGASGRWATHEQLDSIEGARVDELVELFQTAWWTRGRERADVERMLAGSDGAIGVVHKATDRLVAFARFLTDGVYKATLFDVIVAESERGSGLGLALTDALLLHPGLADVAHLELYCLPELVPFYGRWGFDVDVGGVRLMRLDRDPG